MIIKDIFEGALLSKVKCLSCKKKSYRTDVIMDISLDIHRSNSLEHAFARFFCAEFLDGSNKYHCHKCNKRSEARRQTFLKRAPNVLVIQLKRFADVNVKINMNIEFEEDLELSQFTSGILKDSRLYYNLFGSIVHKGDSLKSGHYYAYIKDALGRWYCCNDDNVFPSSTQNALKDNVYILFYLRTNECTSRSKTASPSNEVPSLPKGTATDGDVSVKILENNKKQVSCGNGSSALKGKVDEDTDSQNPIYVNQEPDCDHSVNHIINNNGISVSKRKLFDAERGNCHDASLPENSNYRKKSRKAYIKQFPEEIEKFKEVEAYSNLRSHDWSGRVYKFLLARNRLLPETGDCPNNEKLRE